MSSACGSIIDRMFIKKIHDFIAIPKRVDSCQDHTINVTSASSINMLGSREVVKKVHPIIDFGSPCTRFDKIARSRYRADCAL